MKIHDMNAEQILKRSKLSQTNSNYSLPEFKPKKNEAKTAKKENEQTKQNVS